MIYLRYHVWRFKQYWKKEGRTLKRDILSYRLFSQIGFYVAGISFILWVLSARDNFFYATLVFFAYGMVAHLYRDYHKGYHIGWNRANIKEEALKS